MNARVVGLLLITWAAAGNAWATDGGATATTAATTIDRAALESRLRAREPGPGDDLRTLGPGLEQALVSLARDGKADPTLRSRAVSALAYVPTRTSRKFLETTIDQGVASTKPTDRLLSRKAAMALAWMGGPTTVDHLRPMLGSADLDVRVDAVLALGVTRLPRAAELLRLHREIETDDRVRAHIDRQLKVMETSADPAAPRRRKR